MNEKLTVIILAAGLGTRMRSRKAKVLHEAGGLPVIEHVVLSALALAPASRIIVVVGHQAESVQQKLAKYGVKFVLQAEQRGTGHALQVCRDAVPDHEGRLVVLYGDCPLLQASTLESLFQTHERTDAAATVLTTLLDDPSGYGRMLVNDARRVTAIVEHKVATGEQRAIREINSGIYCFDAPLLWKHLDGIQQNPVSREYYLTDIVELLNGAGKEVLAALHKDSSELLGINTRIELAEVDRIFRERKTRELMLAGVTIEKPETVSIDRLVQAGIDSVIEPFARLLGNTRIGENCRIGAGAILEDAEIGDDVAIAPYTLVRRSKVADRASIGPFARLRQDNVIGAGAHIGNFVELKNTQFGEGAKAGHLAYLGDSQIDACVNVGAGTITCNYDGANKHKTIVGSGAFLGSNSTLVAPVEIGKGSYVAAGSVVTQNVPADALALGRSRQVNKEGWASRKRANASSDAR